MRASLRRLVFDFSHDERQPGTDFGDCNFPSMHENPEYIANLIEVVEDLKLRLLKECEVVERISGDELFEEKAMLRNLVMQLDGLKLQLRRVML